MIPLKKIFSTVKAESPILYGVVMVHFIAAAACMAGLFIDDRTLMGVNVWLKPLKFCISGGIYIFTVGYLTTIYPFSKIKKSIINNTVAWTLLMEIAIIIYQASRGVPSHYNQSTLFDGLLFAAMGILIAVNVLIMVLFIVETIRLKLNTDTAVRWAILIGWLVVLFGSWVGGQMIDQMAHNVGVVDGGAGLPLVNWSTIGGDLRVAHFFGLHGIQIIPLFAVWWSKKWKGTVRSRVIAVTAFGVVYAACIGFTFYQANQGMPLLAL